MVSPLRSELLYPNFTEGKAGLERLIGPQLSSKRGAKQELNLGLSDFRVCDLNGKIAKAPLGDNIQPLTCVVRKRDSVRAASLEEQGVPSAQWPSPKKAEQQGAEALRHSSISMFLALHAGSGLRRGEL